MKILYIGHYKENSGWSQAAIDYILSLDSAGLDIVCKNIKLTNNEYNIPERILELEQKDSKNIDYCIQHVLPHHLVATTKFKKNISYFVGETDTIKHLIWFESLASMDEVWVPNKSYVEVLKKDGLENVKCLPHTFNLNKYKKEYPTLNLKEYNNYFKFYTISEISDRKNIDSIIRCYYSEFTADDNVLLILKVKQNGIGAEQINGYINQKIKDIRTNLRMYNNDDKYPAHLVIANDMTEDQLCSLHKTCDCFVGPSHGEAWSIPSFEAMCFGKTPICSNEGGPKDYIDLSIPYYATGFLINGQYDICNHSNPAFRDIFSGREHWFVPNEQDIKSAMRYAFNNKNNVAIDKTAGINRAENYNYQNIANKIQEYLS